MTQRVRFFDKAYQISNETDVLFAGNFQHKEAKNSTYNLYKMDEWDEAYTRTVPVKENEVIFRFQTELMKRTGIKPLLLVNTVTGMVHFNSANPDTEQIDFSGRGVTPTYMNLIK